MTWAPEGAHERGEGVSAATCVAARTAITTVAAFTTALVAITAAFLARCAGLCEAALSRLAGFAAAAIAGTPARTACRCSSASTPRRRPPAIRPRAVPDRYIPMARLDPATLDKRAVLNELPPLVKPPAGGPQRECVRTGAL